MTRLDNWEDLVRLATKARRRGQIITNFFPDENKMARWCRGNAFFFVEHERTTFLVRRQENFSSLYFLTESPGALFSDIQAFVKEVETPRTIVDVVGFDVTRCPLEEVFKNAGFTVLTVLRRMSRKTPVDKEYLANVLETANVQDTVELHDLLFNHFVMEEEQLPDMEEIHAWIEARHVFVARDETNGEINGFIVFDLFPAALYLRYWFVSPRARGNGLGGKLMRAMFAAGANTKRQYFWVKEDNENAIVRYRHYGFEFEALKDTVLAYGPGSS